MSTHHDLDILLTALLWALGGAAVAWILTWPLRRRSQRGELISVSVVATGASVAAVIGNTRAMFLSMDDEYATITVSLVAGVLAAMVASMSARRFARDKRSVQAAVEAIREGRLPTGGGRKLSGELQTLREQLDSTARTLTESREREQALEASRRELVAWVSHDLRTPLAGLRAMAEALEDGVASSPERYHKQIRIEVDRLSGMVDDLLEISRLQSRAPRARTDRVNLEDLISDVVAAVEPVATLQGVKLRGRTSTLAEVIGSSAELNRALTNLLVNAIRHTGPDGTVEISLRSPNESGATPALAQVAELIVRDQCGGIPEHDLDKVFEVGFRGEPARTPHSGLGAGAGLGLAITRGIVAAHDGSVQVCNTEGGCAFTVRLPLAA
ncbi:HAMP domain-containing histidine kinase [Jatrophihabitans telluris]|uniref:histidine kinase n=1 Tax=Jatrophihabitans telluris TaxID=2038343 RepID=A0ABY4QVT8_9ACTN|nr:HAMP domain-containing sensor histidine kinase [Jatrophihabitans telluris]UQX87776.1 HAMP domain-containing histidine kinase [Jatrophihabitans telluris]